MNQPYSFFRQVFQEKDLLEFKIMKFIYAFIYTNHDLLKQGFQEQIIGSAREILDMVDKVKVAAKSEPENLGYRVSYKVKVAAKFEPENIGHSVSYKVKVETKSEPENLGHRVSYEVKVETKSESENLGHRVKKCLI